MATAATTRASNVRASYVLRSVRGCGAQRYHVYQERMTIGSGDCDVVVDEPGVSTVHAEVLFRNGAVGVRDLASGSGTWVHGRRVHRAVLRPGLTFRVGTAEFDILDVRGGRDGVAQKIDELDPATRIHSRESTPAPVADALSESVLEARTTLPRMTAVVSPANGHEAASVGPSPVFIAEADPARRGWLADAIRATKPVVVDSAAALLQAMQHEPRAVLVLGRALRDMSVAQLVAVLPNDGVRLIADRGVEEAGADVFYRLVPGMRERDLLAVVRSAAIWAGPAASPIKLSAPRVRMQRQIFDICAEVSARPEARTAAAAIEVGIANLVGVVRASCVLHDGGTGRLWTESGSVPIDGNAAGGIVGFVARTRKAVHAPVAGDDPRHDLAVDDPQGSGTESILAVPAASGHDVHAVLVAVRERSRGAFEQADRMALAELGRELGPILARIARVVEAERGLVQLGPSSVGSALLQGDTSQTQVSEDGSGEAIRRVPSWLRMMLWVVLGLLIVGVAGIAVAGVHRGSPGHSSVRQHG